MGYADRTEADPLEQLKSDFLRLQEFRYAAVLRRIEEDIALNGVGHHVDKEDEELLESILERSAQYVSLKNTDDRARVAMSIWVMAFKDFLDIRLPMAEKFYGAPLRQLGISLLELGDGIVRPLFRPVTEGGRPSDGAPETAFKVMCVLVSDEMLEARSQTNVGSVIQSRRDADQEVVRRTRKVASHLQIEMKPETLKGWRRAIREGYDKKPIANISLIHGLHKSGNAPIRENLGSESLIVGLFRQIEELCPPEKLKGR